MQEKQESSFYHNIAIAMGMVLLLVAGWIGQSASHIPSIEQKLEDFIVAATAKLDDHEARIRVLEKK